MNVLDVVDAIHRNRLVAAERAAHVTPDGIIERHNGWQLVYTGTPRFALANSATPLSSAPPDVVDAEAWFAARNAAPVFIVREGIDTELQKTLEARGYSHGGDELAMVRPLAPSPGDDSTLVITEARSESEIEVYGATCYPAAMQDIGIAIARTAASLGFRLFLGSIDGKPVGTSMLAVTDRVAGIYNVGVEEAYRRRGLATALTAAAVSTAQEMGASFTWTGSTDMGRGVYERLGFEPRFHYFHYAR